MSIALTLSDLSSLVRQHLRAKVNLQQAKPENAVVFAERRES